MSGALQGRGRTIAAVLTLAIPSFFLVEARLGDRYLPAYVAYVGALVWFFERRGQELARAMGERRARVLAIVTAAAVIALFAIGYPLASSGRFGAGSDCDDALTLGARALLRGTYPYRETTYLGNPITPMPGALLFALPFELLGNVAYENLFWVGGGALLMRAGLGGDSAATLVTTWLVLLASPAVAHQIVTGTDYLANTVMVLSFSVLLLSATDPTHERGPRRIGSALAAVGLGMALSSRINFVMLVPLLFSRLAQKSSVGAAIGWISLVLASFAAVTLPFVIADPTGFSPAHVSTRLTELTVALAHADVIVPVAGGAVAIILSWPRWNRSTSAFLRNVAIVQATLVLSVTALSASLGQARPLRYTAYGQFFLVFALGSTITSHPSGRARPSD